MNMKVLFVCRQNAGRSQMAEAFFEHTASGEHHSRSAGTRPAECVHAEVVETMAELGIDVEHRIPRQLSADDIAWADTVVTMGCGDECPVVPETDYADWDLEDPAGKAVDEVRRIRDEIRHRIRALVSDLDARSASP